MNGVPPDLPARCRLAQMIGGALVGSVVVYAALVEVIRSRNPDLVAIRFLRARILAPPARGSQPVGHAPALTQRLLSASVVSLTMCLAIAVYGLVLFLLGGRPLDFYTFAIVGLLGLAVFFPRQSQWEEWARSDGQRP